VLITLAENVFKHGDLTAHPAVIMLEIDNTGRLRFHTINRVKAQIPFPRLKSTGLENIRIRLDFAYGNAYNLNLTENEHFFEAELLIL
jgi:LytS/YehU family sensor histidine kinase